MLVKLSQGELTLMPSPIYQSDIIGFTYPLLSTLYYLPFTIYPLLSTLYYLPFTIYPLLSTLYPYSKSFLK